jgi:probable O-glycosylation ligase (exosortase A-associated)
MKTIKPPHLDSRFSQIMIAGSFTLFIALLWVKLPHPALAAIAFLPMLAVLALRIPFILCLAFISFSFFRIHEVFPQLYPLRIPQLLAVGTLGSLAVNLLLKRIDVFWTREMAVFSAFLGLVTIGALLATNRAAAMGSLTGTYIKIAAMVFAIAWLLQNERQYKGLIFTMVLSGIAVGIVALINKSSGIGLVEGTRVTIGRDIGSMLGDPNDLSLVLLFPASFAVAMMLTPGFNSLYRILGLIGFITVCAAVIATQSRGGLLGICAVCGIYAWHRFENKLLLITLGVAALGVLFVLAGVSDRASGGAHEEGIDESAMGRIYAWQAAMGMALHHPIIGVGINNFISNYFEYSPHWDGQNHAVHSTWFGVLAETGMLGLGLFITMITLIARISIKAMRQCSPNNRSHTYVPAVFACSQALQAGLAGFCISGTFLTMGFTWPVYILLSLAIALSHFKNPPLTDRVAN